MGQWTRNLRCLADATAAVMTLLIVVLWAGSYFGYYVNWRDSGMLPSSTFGGPFERRFYSVELDAGRVTFARTIHFGSFDYLDKPERWFIFERWPGDLWEHYTFHVKRRDNGWVIGKEIMDTRVEIPLWMILLLPLLWTLRAGQLFWRERRVGAGEGSEP